MKASPGGHQGSCPQQDHQVRRLGKILKRVLNKASPEAAISSVINLRRRGLCLSRQGDIRELLLALTGDGMDLAPALHGEASHKPHGTSQGKPGADIPAQLTMLQPHSTAG